MAMLVPDTYSAHFICAKVLFDKNEVSNNITVSTENYYSAYNTKNSIILSLVCGDEESDDNHVKELMEYMNSNKQYYDMNISKNCIIP